MLRVENPIWMNVKFHDEGWSKTHDWIEVEYESAEHNATYGLIPGVTEDDITDADATEEEDRAFIAKAGYPILAGTFAEGYANYSREIVDGEPEVEFDTVGGIIPEAITAKPTTLEIAVLRGGDVYMESVPESMLDSIEENLNRVRNGAFRMIFEDGRVADLNASESGGGDW